MTPNDISELIIGLERFQKMKNELMRNIETRMVSRQQVDDFVQLCVDLCGMLQRFMDAIEESPYRVDQALFYAEQQGLMYLEEES